MINRYPEMVATKDISQRDLAIKVTKFGLKITSLMDSKEYLMGVRR